MTDPATHQMTEHWFTDQLAIYMDDCLRVMKVLDDGSIDAVVTDPPYGLEFMSVAWDTFSEHPKGESRFRNEWEDFGSREHARHPSEVARIQRKKALAFYEFSLAWAVECLRILKPGGHLLSFGGTRTYHRLVCAIEDAGFEIRDSLHWVYGSGFPKSLDVSKAIDKAAGVQREVVGRKTGRAATPIRDIRAGGYIDDRPNNLDASAITVPATPEAVRWEGWGTALKPAHEPIVLARKPLAGTVAANVLEHGTGALNIGGCRVSAEERPNILPDRRALDGCSVLSGSTDGSLTGSKASGTTTEGRWPPNILLSHSTACDGECVAGCPVSELDAQSGARRSAYPGDSARAAAYAGTECQDGEQSVYSAGLGRASACYSDTGGASRFFPQFAWESGDFMPFLYQAKAPPKERPRIEGQPGHPTVKPLALMRWLVRLVTPPDGVVLDPFAGTGTTGQAALLENFRAILIERDPGYAALMRKRLGA